MRALVVIPHYGDDSLVFRALLSLGVRGPKLSTERVTVFTLLWGDVCVVNNNVDNRGFTRACNEGLNFGQKGKYDFFWLLNNDCEVPNVESAVRDFEMEFALNPKTGVIGSKIVSLSDPDFIHHAGTLAVFPSGLHKHGRVSRGDFVLRSREKWVTGASFVISKDCRAAIGLLDENFMNYASDSDYCYRARAAGFDVVYLPVTIRHAIGQSAHPSPAQVEVLSRDMTHFAHKWITGDLFRRLDSEFLL